jgi:sec-independent protein translocase protein TatB
MPSFSDSIFLFILALLLFGPKRLPVLARELGKWVGEFRRASNEFKMQMEEELRVSEQADRQKQIAAMEAAAPIAPPLADPVHPHIPTSEIEAVSETPLAIEQTVTLEASGQSSGLQPAETPTRNEGASSLEAATSLPIATSGELSIMPPSTGLPTPRGSASNGSALGGLLNAIPPAPESETHTAPETALHGN